MNTRVRQYGLLPPTENAEVVHEQMHQGRMQGNDWVRAEASGRNMSRELLELCSDFTTLKSARDDARKRRDALEKAIKQKHAATRSRSSSLEQRAELKLAEREYKAASEAFCCLQFGKAPDQIRNDPKLRAKWEAIWGAMRAQQPKRKKGEKRQRTARKAGDANTGGVSQQRRESRATRTVHWGTYQAVEEAKRKSFATTPWYDDDGSPRNPRFARRDDRDHIAVHFQGKPVFTEDILAGTSQAHIEFVPAPPVRRTGEPRKTKREDQYALLHLRVGHKSDPKWATFPMVMHRPLPEKARVSWIKVTATPIGRNIRWTCEITVTDESAHVDHGKGAGAVAVVFGWHKTQPGIRVAAWLSETGEVGELVIGDKGPDEIDIDGGHGGIASGIRRADQIKSDRDKAFNEALRNLCGWLRKHDMPEWMRNRTVKRKYDAAGNVIAQQAPTKAQAIAWLSEWRSQARLVALVRQWSENRIDGDETIFGRRPDMDDSGKPIVGTGAGLEGWRYHDFHLWQFETHQRESARLRRREHYRRFAFKLRGRFGTTLLDGTKFDDLKRNPKASDDKGRMKQPASDQHLAAPGELREIIRHALSGDARVVDPAGTAATCPRCGHEHAAQKHMEDHTFACLKCDFAGRDISTVRLMNMLRKEGYGKQVDKILRRQEDLMRAMRKDGYKKVDKVLRRHEEPVSKECE